MYAHTYTVKYIYKHYACKHHFQFLPHSDLKSDRRKSENSEAAPHLGLNLSRSRAVRHSGRLRSSGMNACTTV